MVLEMLEHYEAIVDGLQIFLCILILFFLARNHRRRMKPELMNPKSESDQDFNLQVFSQTINQQVELAFTNILKVAANERRDLVKVLQLHQHTEKDHGSSEGRSPTIISSSDYPAQSVPETCQAIFNTNLPEHFLTHLKMDSKREPSAKLIEASKLRWAWEDLRALPGISEKIAFARELLFD